MKGFQKKVGFNRLLISMILGGTLGFTPNVIGEHSYEHGLAAITKGNYAEAFPLIKKSAESGNVTSQFILSTMYRRGLGVEADEYDRSFLTLNPDIAVVTALDPDHLDIYGEFSEMQKGFRDFINRLKKKGTQSFFTK